MLAYTDKGKGEAIVFYMAIVNRKTSGLLLMLHFQNHTVLFVLICLDMVNRQLSNR